MNIGGASLTQSRLRKLLHYDPKTGIFTWLVRASMRIKAGDVAGTLHKKHGYLIIGVDCCLYKAHRLAWFYVHGEWPPQLDHRDTIRSHNWIANLRPATTSQNNANSGRRSHNTSGFKGVCWDKAHQRWRAYIGHTSRQNYLGLYDTPEAAHAAYCAAAREAYGEFARSE